MDQAGSNDKKTGGKKSRWTIPLSKVYVCMYCVLYNHHSPVSDLISVLWILIRQNLNYIAGYGIESQIHKTISVTWFFTQLFCDTLLKRK